MTSWIAAEWLAAITSSSIVAILGFILGTYYKAQVEKSVQHRFDVKLEKFRASVRLEEEQLRADLRTKGEHIAALRSGALSSLANRHDALDKRRLDAVDRLWKATVGLGQLKQVTKWTAAMNMDYALEAVAKRDSDADKLREFANVLWTASGLDKPTKNDSPHSERPFLPPMVWALYSAYSQILGYSAARLAALRSGLGANILRDQKPLLDLVKSALPHQKDFVDKFGIGGLPYLVDELEEKLHQEIQRALSNPEADKASLEQAAAILKSANELSESLNTSDDPSQFILKKDTFGER